MSDLQIAWTMLGSIGGFGVLLTLLGVLIWLIKKRKYSLCTEKTKGIVIKHRFPGEDKMFPIVEYTVGDTTYSVRKKFRGVKAVSVSGMFVPLNMEASAWEDKKGWLHIKHGPIAPLGELAEKLWPIGSEMTVYYNPEDPKMSYAERPITVGFESTMFVIFGLVIFALGVLLFSLEIGGAL